MSYKKGTGSVIPKLAAAGMPVGYLRYVLANYDVKVGDYKRNETDTLFNNVKFKTATYKHLVELKPNSLGVYQSTAVGTLYHEFTHAYFDKRDSDPRVKQMFAKAVPYYRNVTLKTEGSRKSYKSTNEREIAGEAAANYIDSRTAAYWNAFQTLT